MADQNGALTNPNNPKTKQEWAEFLGPLVSNVRDRRTPQEQAWLNYHSAWRGRHTRSFFKSDVFNQFIPAARRSVEKYVVRGAQMLVPSPEFFEVYPGDDADDQMGKRAESVRAFHSFLWTRKIKPYPLVRQLLRTYAMYSRAIAKSYIRVTKTKDLLEVWPHARAVDPFVFYVYPETVVDLDDATLVFEDNMMPWSTYEQNVQMKMCDPIAQRDLTNPSWPTHWSQRLQESGIVDPSGASTGHQNEVQSPSDKTKKTPLIGFVAMTEVWVHRPGYWQQFWLVWNVPDGPRIVRINERRFARHGYRMAAARDLPGEHYTTGLMDDLEPLQVLLNDQVNMTLEGMATNFSPPTVIDPDQVTRMSSIMFRPRAKWLAKPEGIKFLETKDTTKTGYQGISFTMGLMDQYAGMGPLADGAPTRNMPRSGFAVSSLIQMSMSDIKDGAQMIEDLLLTPLMADLHNLTMEFVPPTQILKIPGTKDFPPKQMLKEEMNGDWEFKWVGSLQSQDYQVRAQRLVALLGQISKIYPIVAEDLMRRGKKINIELILKRVWRDGLGERGADSIIEEIPPQELLQIQMERLAMAIGAGQAQAASQQGMANAAKPPGAPPRGARPRPKAGGGGNVSIPGNAQDMDANMQRQAQDGGLGNETGLR